MIKIFIQIIFTKILDFFTFLREIVFDLFRKSREFRFQFSAMNVRRGLFRNLN